MSENCCFDQFFLLALLKRFNHSIFKHLPYYFCVLFHILLRARTLSGQEQVLVFKPLSQNTDQSISVLRKTGNKPLACSQTSHLMSSYVDNDKKTGLSRASHRAFRPC